MCIRILITSMDQSHGPWLRKQMKGLQKTINSVTFVLHVCTYVCMYVYIEKSGFEVLVVCIRVREDVCGGGVGYVRGRVPGGIQEGKVSTWVLTWC